VGSSCPRITNWPEIGRRLRHVTQFRNFGTPSIFRKRVQLRSSNLARTGGGILWRPPSRTACYYYYYYCEDDIKRMNRYGCKLVHWSIGQRNVMTNIWGQEVKGQGHATPKLDLEVWWSHHSRSLRSSRFASLRLTFTPDTLTDGVMLCRRRFVDTADVPRRVRR